MVRQQRVWSVQLLDGVCATAARNPDGWVVLVVFNGRAEPWIFTLDTDGQEVSTSLGGDAIPTIVKN